MMKELSLSIAMVLSICLHQSTHGEDGKRIVFDKNGNLHLLAITGTEQSRTHVSEKDIDDMLVFDGMRAISLFGTDASDDAVAKIVAKSSLRSLDLSYTSITDACADSLSELKGLQILKLTGTVISDKALAAIAKLPSLSILHIGKTKITDKGLLALRDHATLNLLDLSGCDISDSGLASLGNPPVLRNLWIGSASPDSPYATSSSATIERKPSQLTDRCIGYLLTLKELADLDITGTNISVKGLERLRKGLNFATVRTGK